MKACIYFLLTLAFTGIVHAADVTILDSKPVFEEPLANVRSPDTGITANTAKYHKERIYYLEAALGYGISVISLKLDDINGGDLFLQFGLASGFWATLGYDDGAFPLLTQDFLISAPIEFKWGDLSGAIKFNHISAHLGDGFDKLLEKDLSKEEQEKLDNAEDFVEEVAGDDDVGITLKEPFAYSRDFFSLHVAYNYRIGRFDSRVYYHIGYVHKMIPDDMARWFFGSGFETVYPGNIFSPYQASDFTYNQDTDSVDWSSEVGVIILSNKTNYFSLRVAATMFIGKDRRGQLYGNKLKQFGVGFFFY